MLTAMPELMEVLCRIGNADHGIHRAATATQMWRRMLAIKTEDPGLGDEDWVMRACLGVSKELGAMAPYLPKFVKTWSGGMGDKAYILQDVERFEQGSKVRRDVPLALFKVMADVPPRPMYQAWIPAMIKAIIVAPRQYAENGLLAIHDVNSITRGNADGVKEASEYLVGAKAYLTEHVSMSDATLQSHLDQLVIEFLSVKV